MKNIVPGLILAIILLPAMSFGDNDAKTAFTQQQDTASNAFFAQQAQERGAWIKANPGIIAALDQYGKALIAYKDAQREAALTGKPSSVPAPTPPPPDSAYEAFKSKQQSEGKTFLQKLAQDKKDFLSQHPEIPASTTTPSTTTPSAPTTTSPGN